MTIQSSVLLLCCILLLSIIGLRAQSPSDSIQVPIKRGVIFTNAPYSAGLRLNPWDRRVVRANGFNLGVWSRKKESKGLSIGLLGTTDSLGRGVDIGGVFASGTYLNGVVIGGLVVSATKINGLAISGLVLTADTLNGVFITPWCVASLYSYKEGRVINGLAIGGYGVAANKLSGVSLSIFNSGFDEQRGLAVACFNSTKVLHGVQIGLWNYAGNNPKWLRHLPLINMHWGK